MTTAGLGTGPAAAGGLLLYEFGTAEVGLAAAGYSARAQDASTAFTNPAGMTRLAGTQVLAGGQLMWLNNRFSVGSGSSAALGADDGGRALGANGFVPGGGAFVTHSLSPDLRIGFAVAGNFGSILDYDDTWVGRYRVQDATILGISFVPSIAYRVNDKLSVGAGVNAMYGVFKQQVAINNVVPGTPDGQLKLDDNAWGLGANLGLMYDVTPATRIGLTWNSRVELDFEAPAQFSGLGPGFSGLFGARGLLDAQVKLGVKVPQQVMASVLTQLDERWALLGNVGWQQWSEFGEVEVGVENTLNPVGLTTALDFKDTWHVAVGAQLRVSDTWKLNFGVAYDSGFQSSDDVSPLLPVNAAWRFGVGGEQQVSKVMKWGIAGELLYGGTLEVDKRSTLAPALGGRGNLVGSYETTASVVVSVYGNWTF
ncbi:MAG: outer membrane protein transport protein [Burkholderiales bacterium]|nr:outer membrane protein transport protein [Burkholderiales bacterium]